MRIFVFSSRWQTVLQVQRLAANPNWLTNVSVHLTMVLSRRQSKGYVCCAWHAVHAALLDSAELFVAWTMMAIRRCRLKSSRKDCMTPVWIAAKKKPLKYSKSNYFQFLNNKIWWKLKVSLYIQLKLFSFFTDLTQTKVEQSICLSFWLNCGWVAFIV